MKKLRRKKSTGSDVSCSPTSPIQKSKGKLSMEEMGVPPEHHDKLDQLKQLLAEEHGKDVVDSMRDLEENGLLRFLRARKYDPVAAAKMAHKYMVFRKKYNVDEITMDSVQDQIKTGKAFLHGFDKKGRPCIVVQLRYHIASQNNLHDLIRFIFFMFESAIDRMPDGVEQLCIIYDRSGMTRANFDLGMVKLVVELSSIVQDFYAERLGNFYVLYPNWFYWWMWKAVKMIIDKTTVAKFHIMDDIEKLKEDFEPDQLLEKHGGESKFEFSYPDSIAMPPLESDGKG